MAGICLAFGLHAVLVLPALAVFSLLVSLPPIDCGWEAFSFFLIAPGLVQFVYMIPAAIWLHRKGERTARSGLLTVAALGVIWSLLWLGMVR